MGGIDISGAIRGAEVDTPPIVEKEEVLPNEQYAFRAIAHARNILLHFCGQRCGLPLAFYSKASGGGQAQTRLRSPNALSTRRTGGQYLLRIRLRTGYTASSREYA